MSNPPADVSRAEPTPPPPKRHVAGRFFFDLFRLPLAHKSILVIALGLLGYGWVHYFADAGTQDYWGQLARRVGGSVLIGFVVGWAFRTFVKIMAAGTLVCVGLLSASSYFHVMNVDFTSAAEQKYKDASAWMSDQGTRVYDGVLKHLHSTGGALVGAYVGFRKKII
jgi:uncharacterized membrane protein (Fun14 family)